MYESKFHLRQNAATQKPYSACCRSTPSLFGDSCMTVRSIASNINGRLPAEHRILFSLLQRFHSLILRLAFCHSFFMSKHNRRRTRRGHKASMQRDGFELHSLEELFGPGLSSCQLPFQRKDNLSTCYWNTGYLQVRERKQRAEKENLTQERRRVFGDCSDPTDDDLCTAMLNYFQGLEYLN